MFSNNSTESETQPLLLPRPPRTPRNSEGWSIVNFNSITYFFPDEERHRLDAVLPSTDSSIVFEATGPQDSDTILLPVPQSA